MGDQNQGQQILTTSSSFWHEKKVKVLEEHAYSKIMKEQLVFAPEKPAIENHILALTKKIPLLSGLLNGVSGVSGSVSKLVEIQGHITRASHVLKNASPYTGLTIAIIDFIRIPMIYLAALLVGEKLPISLSKRAQWLYSAVLLGLTITALTVPVAAPIIAFVFAGLGLAVSLFTMGKAIQLRFKNRAELMEVNKLIAEKTKGLNELCRKTVDLEKNLEEPIEGDEEARKASISKELEENLKSFSENLYTNKEALQELCNKKLTLEEKIEKTNNRALMGKGVGLALTALATVGLVLTLFFPPIGLALLAASAATGLVYMIGELSIPAFKGLLSRISKKEHKEQQVDSTSESSKARVPLVSPAPGASEYRTGKSEPATKVDKDEFVSQDNSTKGRSEDLEAATKVADLGASVESSDDGDTRSLHL